MFEQTAAKWDLAEEEARALWDLGASQGWAVLKAKLHNRRDQIVSSIMKADNIDEINTLRGRYNAIKDIMDFVERMFADAQEEWNGQNEK